MAQEVLFFFRNKIDTNTFSETSSQNSASEPPHKTNEIHGDRLMLTPPHQNQDHTLTPEPRPHRVTTASEPLSGETGKPETGAPVPETGKPEDSEDRPGKGQNYSKHASSTF